MKSSVGAGWLIPCPLAQYLDYWLDHNEHVELICKVQTAGFLLVYDLLQMWACVSSDTASTPFFKSLPSMNAARNAWSRWFRRHTYLHWSTAMNAGATYVTWVTLVSESCIQHVVECLSLQAADGSKALSGAGFSGKVHPIERLHDWLCPLMHRFWE